MQGQAGAALLLLLALLLGLLLLRLRVAAGLARIAALAGAGGRRDLHRNLAAVALHQVLAQALADLLQLAGHLAMAGGQTHLQLAGLLADRDLDPAQQRRAQRDRGLLAAAGDLQLQPVAQGLHQRLLPLARLALELHRR